MAKTNLAANVKHENDILYQSLMLIVMIIIF